MLDEDSTQYMLNNANISYLTCMHSRCDLYPVSYNLCTEQVFTNGILQGFAVPKESQSKVADFKFQGQAAQIKHGDVVIAAITSCTNISNPSVMLGAALVAKKACELGLEVNIPHDPSLTWKYHYLNLNMNITS